MIFNLFLLFFWLFFQDIWSANNQETLNRIKFRSYKRNIYNKENANPVEHSKRSEDTIERKWDDLNDFSYKNHLIYRRLKKLKMHNQVNHLQQRSNPPVESSKAAGFTNDQDRAFKTLLKRQLDAKQANLVYKEASKTTDLKNYFISSENLISGIFEENNLLENDNEDSEEYCGDECEECSDSELVQECSCEECDFGCFDKDDPSQMFCELIDNTDHITESILNDDLDNENKESSENALNFEASNINESNGINFLKKRSQYEENTDKEKEEKFLDSNLNNKFLLKHNLWYLNYVPYTEEGLCKTKEDIDYNLKLIPKKGFNSLCIYNSDPNALKIIGEASIAHNIDIILGIYIYHNSINTVNNDINSIFSGVCKVEELMLKIKEIKQKLNQLKLDIPITTEKTIVTYKMYLQHYSSPMIDLVGLNSHAFSSNNISTSLLKNFIHKQTKEIQKIFPRLQISILESK
ncbi:uncharacterized protein T551_01071 [Pneumocystis jirovecii RU7]|uniref:Uncharacterized protein n=1 Tax=Pneumocystis jirovecii (strain RU7) TaxID=1408657 RepID=A0A0W4ZTV0_PNEJ7|nr:uncharacterized protein T551_01071 [Pneumocystis jirovecii RU7]KTW31810.1 hypothetical protein T551_01071 [Pneumocystis jirovecii RU7]